MVAHVLRLRFDVLVGALRFHRARALAALAATVVLVGAIVLALLRLQDAPYASALVVLAVGGAAVSACFALVPLVTPVRDPLDPRAFIVTGRDWRLVAASTAAASPLSLPSAAVIVVSVAVALTWIAHGVDPVAAVFGAALIVVTQLLLARVALGVAALVLAERRSRELTTLLLLGIGVVAIPVAVFLASLNWDDGVPGPLLAAVGTLAVTPIGAAWVLPLDPRPTVVIVAVLTAAALAVAWILIVRRMLTHTERPVSVRERRGLGWFTVTPGTPGGAVAARSLVYWLRDPRYLVDIAIIPVASVVAVVPLVIVGVPHEIAALIPAPLIALLLGWVVHNDLAYDGSAVWLHISSAVRGASDRVGRLVPLLLVALPLLAIAIPVGIGIHGDWGVLPVMVGVCSALLLGGLGLSSVSSVLAPYAVARHGDSPFQQPQRTGGGLAQGAVLVGALLAAAPALWWSWRFLLGESHAQWWALGTGVGVGLVVLVAGILIGGLLFDRRGDRLMAFAETT
ncbi:hypothetical protein CBF90_07530 [Microbacterium sp. AISO3]|uniref:hypothetical protein n=1 Tax=unclassified Microbacterium TaxID=2609290 RepID=UPI000B4D6483|nr:MULTISPECIES: hypothetical protein [unclassified Microbacterium]OWP22063.1 hypothetical protein CBF90_07530 [Microbacterium sp. AISO3]POX67174.1 hypothetical protein C3481_02655 [Microbacterium sp. Ru50]